MIGRLEIERLRDLAEASLGERFAITDLHRVVLGNGMSPLDELAGTIGRWIDTRSRRDGAVVALRHNS